MATRFTFGTKAETLTRLSGRLHCGVVLPLDYFTVGEWRSDEDGVLDRLCAHDWAYGVLIVRSSSLDEDTATMSNAGHYLSRSHVSGRGELKLAVEQVIASFHGRSDTDQVLVQPELDQVVASGVASSREPSGGGPYRVITYAEGSHTDAVTAGRDGTRTWYCLAYDQGSPAPPPSPRLAGVLALIDELEQLVDVPFELEFGVSEHGPVVLFQVRPLAVSSQGVAEADHRAAIADCRAQLRRLSQRRPPALGPFACFGVMPDWNPAEMIGVRPRPLALSLYRCLITDETWAESRARYGYRDLRGVPLLVDFCGLPYIDARASFSSLVPANFDDGAAERLVAHYVSTLRAQPHLHDKIESAIALSAYDFDVPENVSQLVEEGVLSTDEASELVEALRTLTMRMMAADGPFARDLDVAAKLARMRPDGAPGSPLRRIATQLDDCRALGTLPFAGLARAAFVAVNLVNSLVRQGVFTDQEGAALIGGANDVTKDLRRDLSTLDRDGFLHRYGHLRPGTYDIRSARYDESFERYFDGSRRAEPSAIHPHVAQTPRQLSEIGRLIESHGLECEPAALIDFIRRAVAARERSKLDFSRLVSQVLVDVRQLGEQLGFDVDEMSFVPVPVLRGLAEEPDDAAAAVLADAIRRGQERYRVTETLCAPALLRDDGDLGSFVTMEDEPNFVTHARVVAPPADVIRGDVLDGRIAMIASADPGWDWIFTHKIVGLITAFGGANSHMSLRALELDLPAAIGVGEDRFRRWLTAPSLELDAANRLVRPLSSAEEPVVVHAALHAARSGSA